MSKRHKKTKPRQNVKPKSKRSKTPRKLGRISNKPRVHKTLKKTRAVHPKRTGKARPRPKIETNVVAKGASIYKRGTPKQLRSDLRASKTAKKSGNLASNRKGKKTSRKIQAPIRKRDKQKFVEKLKRKKQLETELEKLTSDLENLNADLERNQGDFTNKIKPKNEKFKQVSKGHFMRENLVKGFRYWYKMYFPDGSFADKLDFIHNVDLSFLNHALKRNVKEPRAVYISLESEYNKITTIDDENIREEKTSLYDAKTSDPDFIVNLLNIKKMIIDMMIYWQDNFLERLQQQGESYLDGSGEGYNPDNLISVSFRFIY